MVTGMIEQEAGVRVEEFVAIGGGAASALWRQIVADASGKPVKLSRTVEASSLGAAMCAAAGAGWFASVPAAAAAMSGTIADSVEPDPVRVARYAELLSVYREIYPRLRKTYRSLAKFQHGADG